MTMLQVRRAHGGEIGWYRNYVPFALGFGRFENGWCGICLNVRSVRLASQLARYPQWI